MVPPTALPMAYSIDPLPGADWLYQLTWHGTPLDTFYSIGDAVDAGLTHFAFVEAEYGDTGMGDIHGLTPAAQWEAEAVPIAELELSMLDTCLGAPHSDGEAGCVLVELESQGIYVEPVLCGWCGRTHLKRVGR